MLKSLLAFLFLSNFAFAALQGQSFQAYVDSLVPGAKLGLSLRSVQKNKSLLDIRGDEFFIPASTLKTLTTATALYFLPLSYEPKTSLHLEGSVQKNVFVGNLRFYGEGDPNFSGRYFKDAFFMFKQMTDSLKSLGITKIHGDLIADTSFYTGPRRPEHWKSNYYDAWYGAEVSPLSFNDNCALIRLKPGEKVNDSATIEVLPDVDFVKIINHLKTVPGRTKKWKYSLDKEKALITITGQIGVNVDSASLVLPVRNPAAYFLSAFQKTLADEGIEYIHDPNMSGGIEIKAFSFSVVPFLSVLDEINQRSQNLHAEMLFRNIGKHLFGEGSVKGGKKAEEYFLSKIGLSYQDFEVFDGSGLSPLNKVKPSVVSELLSKMARSPYSYYYIESFASPNIGTGSQRMSSLEAPFQTRFKTGYIGGVHALVGYIFTLPGDTLSLSVYLNDTGKNPDHKLKDVIDTIWSRVVTKTNENYSSLLEAKKLWLDAQEVKGLEARLDYFSKSFLNRPYLLGPMGESYLDSIDSKALIHLDSMDCVTYIEHSLALALSIHEDSIFNTLQNIRYTKGEISYSNRKHYFVEDFLKEGRFAEIRRFENEAVIFRKLPKTQFFASKKIKYSGEDPETEIPHLPFKEALDFAKNIWDFDFSVWGVAFIGNSSKIDVTHIGFLILKPGEKPILRHASQLKKRVVNQSLEEYLKQRKGKTPGIVVFEFLKKS